MTASETTWATYVSNKHGKKTVIRLDLLFMRLELRKRAALEGIVFKA